MNNIKEYAKYIPTETESRWSDVEEIKSSTNIRQIDVSQESCDACGLPIISDGTITYVDNMDTHSLIFGATGSKKTRLFGMPLMNMMALAGESVIVTDPKGEIYDKTSGLFKSKGYEIICLNMRELTKSAGWNPLDLMHKYYHSGEQDKGMALMNDFIQAFSEPNAGVKLEPFWILSARTLLNAYLSFFLETASYEQAHIFNFAKFLSSGTSTSGAKVLISMMSKGSTASVNLGNVLSLASADETFGCVVSTATSYLQPFISSRELCRMMSKSTFDMINIGRKKTVVYLIVPDEKTTFHFLISTFVKQVYEALINEAQQLENKSLPVRVNFILDEFCNIPTIPDMASMISAARSRNMRFFLYVQGSHQLRGKYGYDAETIKGNCENIVFLSSREFELLSEFSYLCGNVAYTDARGNYGIKPLISTSDL